MRLAASRNSVLRSSVGGGPAGAGIGAHRGRRLAEALLGRLGRGPVVHDARARGDDRQDLRLELLHLHVDDADQRAGSRTGTRASSERSVACSSSSSREPVAQLAQARPRTRSIRRARMRSPSARSPLWSYSLVTHGAQVRASRAAVSSENARST